MTKHSNVYQNVKKYDDYTVKKTVLEQYVRVGRTKDGNDAENIWMRILSRGETVHEYAADIRILGQ